MDIANTIANDKHLCQIQQEMKVNFAKKAVANKTFASTEQEDQYMKGKAPQ